MDKIIRIFSINRKHVKALIGIAIIILASSTIVSYLNSRDLLKTETGISESYRNLQRMEKLLSTMIDAETGRRGYFITEDPELLWSYNNASSTIDTLYAKIKSGTQDNPVQQENLDTLRSLIRRKFTLFEQSIRLQQSKGTSMKLHKPLMDDGNEALNGIRRVVENMKTEERRVLEKGREISSKTADFTTYGMLGGSSVSIILLFLSYTLMMKLSTGKYEDAKSFKMSRDELESLVRDRTAEISQLSMRLNNKTSEVGNLKASMAQFEQSYKLLAEQSHDAIIIFSPDSQVVLDVNSKACDLYGIKHKDFIGLSLKYLSKNVPETIQHIKETVDKGAGNKFQTVNYKKDGTEMLLDVNAGIINFHGSAAVMFLTKEITGKMFQVV